MFVLLKTLRLLFLPFFVRNAISTLHVKMPSFVLILAFLHHHHFKQLVSRLAYICGFIIDVRRKIWISYQTQSCEWVCERRDFSFGRLDQVSMMWSHFFIELENFLFFHRHPATSRIAQISRVLLAAPLLTARVKVPSRIAIVFLHRNATVMEIMMIWRTKMKFQPC